MRISSSAEDATPPSPHPSKRTKGLQRQALAALHEMAEQTVGLIDVASANS